ncbi:MAG: NAD(P)H-dependent oxidoreductase subunit E [Armatimonadetes bacterium]|nr:NAD(P)H-dependent oxidoreductase subunit E [Armatimonadota bacterium]
MRGDTIGADAPDVAAIAAAHRGSRAALIAILREVQAARGYLPEDALRAVARHTGRSLVDVYAVASFYHSFSLKPRGRHTVCACLGTACHVRGGQQVVEALSRELGVRAGETTPDGEFTLETANCLGACALGPVVVVDGRYFAKVNPGKVRRILSQARSGVAAPEAADGERALVTEAVCPECGRPLLDAARPIDGYPSLQVSAQCNGWRGRARISCVDGVLDGAPENAAALERVRLFCPHCSAGLNDLLRCGECGVPTVSVLAGDGALVQMCGCGEQRVRRAEVEGAGARREIAQLS